MLKRGWRVKIAWYSVLLLILIWVYSIRKMKLGQPILQVTAPVFVSILCVYICAYTDLLTGYVYDFVVLLGIIALLFQKSMYVNHALYLEWVLFAFVQSILFRRLYADGDVLVFILCGGILSSVGQGMLEDLLLMLCSVVVMGVHQGLRGNIKADGNLKKGIAFVPYMGMCLPFFL